MKNTQVSIDTLSKILPVVSPVSLPRILEENVGNFCPSCGKTIFSNLLEIDGKVYLEKNCCTKELVFMENDVDFFCKHKKNTEAAPVIPNANNWWETISKKPDYATTAVCLYITTKCNMNCPACYLRQVNCLNQGPEMSLKEVKERLKKYHSQQIILFGGEPTLHKNLWEIIKTVKESGNTPGIVTNGLKLEDKNYVKKLKEAGIKLVGLQFDGFNRATNIKLRGQDYTETKLKALKNIKEVGGFREVLIQSIIERGGNETEMRNIIQFGLENEFVTQVAFTGLMLPANENNTDTTFSDMIKVMEKEGYFDREYFLELVKMFCNVQETARKIFDGTPMEAWLGKKLKGGINAVPFKKGVGSTQLLFQRNEIKEINQILSEAINKKNRLQTLSVLLKNSVKLAKTPLLNLTISIRIANNGEFSSKKLLIVHFHTLGGAKNHFLKSMRGAMQEWLPIMIAGGEGINRSMNLMAGEST